MSRAVLVVDDDQFIRKLVATTLEDVSEFDLHEASDGVEALEVAQGTQPAIVFLDIDMPRMDGIDTCRRMRADPQMSHATIVMLTAAHGDQTERMAEEAGADLFLTKPFSPLELLKLVDRHGEGARAAARGRASEPFAPSGSKTFQAVVSVLAEAASRDRPAARRS
jgi:CheY-like chemotaxis protein